MADHSAGQGLTRMETEVALMHGSWTRYEPDLEAVAAFRQHCAERRRQDLERLMARPFWRFVHRTLNTSVWREYQG